MGNGSAGAAALPRLRRHEGPGYGGPPRPAPSRREEESRAEPGREPRGRCDMAAGGVSFGSAQRETRKPLKKTITFCPQKVTHRVVKNK